MNFTATSTKQEILKIRPDFNLMSEQSPFCYFGISEKTVASQALSMHICSVPPKAVATPHLHQDYEEAIYVLDGQFETRFGDHLENSIICCAGDFVFIPPGLLHDHRNLSDTDLVRAIVARNDPSELEHKTPCSLKNVYKESFNEESEH